MCCQDSPVESSICDCVGTSPEDLSNSSMAASGPCSSTHFMRPSACDSRTVASGRRRTACRKRKRVRRIQRDSRALYRHGAPNHHSLESAGGEERLHVARDDLFLDNGAHGNSRKRAGVDAVIAVERGFVVACRGFDEHLWIERMLYAIRGDHSRADARLLLVPGLVDSAPAQPPLPAASPLYI